MYATKHMYATRRMSVTRRTSIPIRMRPDACPSHPQGRPLANPGLWDTTPTGLRGDFVLVGYIISGQSHLNEHGITLTSLRWHSVHRTKLKVEIDAIMNLLPLLLLLTAIPLPAQTHDTLRVCTYNLLNWGINVDSARAASTEAVLRAIQPDVLVAHVISSTEGYTRLLASVRSAVGRPMAGVWEDGPDTKNAIFYDSTSLEWQMTITMHTTLRDINEWVFVVRSSPTDTLHIFGCNLKAGTTAADSAQRSEEASLIRRAANVLPYNHHWIVAGDLNTYSSTEGAYTWLTSISRSQPGFVFDPIDRPGDWHSDSTFTDIHNQSTRIRQFGGGVGGGLDDRFDFVLLSSRLMNDHYQQGSYTTFGNDGRHFDDSINAKPNLAVSDSTAQALYDASDHLPVYLDLVFLGRVSGVEEERPGGGLMDLSEGTEIHH